MYTRSKAFVELFVEIANTRGRTSWGRAGIIFKILDIIWLGKGMK